MLQSWKNRLTWTGIGLGTGLALRAYLRQRQRIDLTGQVVVITGGSRGLGLALAREFARQGCHLALCARNAETLEAARREFEHQGTEIYVQLCDVSKRDQVMDFVSNVHSHYGHIDILVNNAGIITVGPQQSMNIEDYEVAMNIMYWGMVSMTLSTLPVMRKQGSGRIVNITSIGGKVSIPHLLTYSAAKFAATGFSEGLRAELAQDGIIVTTVAPGLMRTGSHIHVILKGNKEAEYTWFSLGATWPGISMQAERAARHIVDATRRGDAEITLTPQAKLLSAFHGVFPGLTSNILSVVSRLMPKPPIGDTKDADVAYRHTTPVANLMTKPAEPAIHRLHQNYKHD